MDMDKYLEFCYALNNDAELKALHEQMMKLYQCSIPKYVISTGGTISITQDKQFNESINYVVQQIELRTNQIMRTYNID